MAGRFAQLVSEQREEEAELLERRLVPREAGTMVPSLLEEDRVVVITGPRRAGKSTLALMSVADRHHLYLDFDDERLAGIRAEDLDPLLEAALEEYGPAKCAVLDEVQHVPGWELFVERLRRRGYKLVVTGSSADLLSRELSSRLAGRHVALPLLPFSFREHLRWKGVPFGATTSVTTERRAELGRSLEEHIALGGFPEVLASSHPSLILRHLYEDIVVKDALLRHKIRYARTFRDMARELVSGFACPASYSRVARRHGIRSVHTVANYVESLVDAYLVLRLDRFSPRAGERALGLKKLYCVDTGLARHVSYSTAPDRGRLLENLVAVELWRRALASPGVELYHWRDAAGREVDFVVREGARVASLVQSCYDPEAPGSERELDALARAAAHLRCRDLRVVTWESEGEVRANGRTVKLEPVLEWLLSWPSEREGG